MNMINPIMASTPVQQSKCRKSNGENVIDNHEKIVKSSPSQYLTLEDVFNEYPLEKNSIIVSIFAIIQSYDPEKGVLIVMDETRKDFAIKFIRPIIHTRPQCVSVNQSPRLPTRTGDIIRINKLFLHEDFTRTCNVFEDIVIFESFKDEIFNPFFVDQNGREFTDEDRNKVTVLTHLNVAFLLEANVRSTRTKYQYLVDTAFQVLCKFKYDNRIILACWNGCPFEDYPCMQLIKVRQIIDTLNGSESKPNVYSEEFIRKIYDQHGIVFISVYGIHRVVATALKPLDFIVVYNLLIKSDNFYYAKHSFIVFDGLNYGRCIRLVDENSELGKFNLAKKKNLNFNLYLFFGLFI